MTDYSKKTFDDCLRAWEQLLGAKTIEQAFQIQSQYAKNACDAHMAEMKKLGRCGPGSPATRMHPSKKRREEYPSKIAFGRMESLVV